MAYLAQGGCGLLNVAGHVMILCVACRTSEVGDEDYLSAYAGTAAEIHGTH